MKNWLDYVYYRVTKAYIKWDGSNGNVGILAVTMVEGILLMNFYVFCMSLFYSRTEWKTLPIRLSHIGIAVIVFFIIVNYRRYFGKYEKYDAIWSGEGKQQKRIRGLFVIISLILPWFLFFLLDRHTAV